MEFYIGQTFDSVYPPQAAVWCNENNCMITAAQGGGYRIEVQPGPTPEHQVAALEAQIDVLNIFQLRDLTIMQAAGPGSDRYAEAARFFLEKEEQKEDLRRQIDLLGS